MHDEKRHFDEDSEPKVSNEFGADLKALFTPVTNIPPEIDRAVMDRAYQKLIPRQKKHRIFRFSACAAAAVAAVVIITLSLNLADRESRTASFRSDIIAVADKTDIDQNGSVDVLDAFRLAHHIESADRPDMKWDVNGDGAVDKNDVDTVAFAAVRLDKGIL
jgi:hypothetical protein